MQIKSLLKKIFIMTHVKLKLSNLLIDDGIYYKSTAKHQFKKILFYFPFYEFMHYGDHLFFEPIIKFLVQSDFDVFICPIDGMRFYFEDIGYNLVNKDEVYFSDYDLIISRVEFFNLLTNVKNLIMFKIVYPNLKRPLSQDMIDKLAKLLNIPSIDMTSYSQLQTAKYSPGVFEGLNLCQNKKSIIFNPYTDSGSYSVTENDLEKLMDFAIKYAKENDCQIILTGSKKEQQEDKTLYPSNFIDIRALTTIPDLFVLLNSDLITSYVGFDGFLMHLANMYNKPSFVYVRRSTMIQRGKEVYKMLVPYISDKNFVTMINNI